jgi:hypothetical protein
MNNTGGRGGSAGMSAGGSGTAGSAGSTAGTGGGKRGDRRNRRNVADEDNYECREGICVSIGCVSNDECSAAQSAPSVCDGL